MSYNINEAFLASKSYGLDGVNKGQTISGPDGSRWLVVDTSRETSTGYQGALLKNLDTGKYELASRGTQLEVSREGVRDLTADAQMGLGQLPNQVADARAFLKNSQDYITEKGGNPGSDLSLTGHSLGGSITQVLGAENPQLRATAFNPYGTGNLIPEGDSHPNVTNHVTSSDSVSTMPGSNMVGETLRYESPGGHSIGQFVDATLASQSGVHVTINMPPVQGIDSDPMGTGDGAAIMNAANGETQPEPEVPEIIITAPRPTLDNYLHIEGANLTTKQQDALAAQIDKLNLGGDKELSFYALPNGGALIANADGDIVGEIVHSSAGDLNLKATAIAVDGSVIEVNQHIGEQGTVQTQEQYNAATQQQATAMFNSLMAVNNWEHLSDVGKLSALVNLYNATDKLGEAFGATGDNLPGDLGAAAGYLQLAQGLQSGDSLVIANGINVVSDGALDGALNQAFGNTAAGEAVPYLSYALAVRNFEENPEVAIGTMAGTYIGEGLGAAFGGPIGAAIGGAIGGMIGGAFGGMFGSGPPPPPEGAAHFSWDESGHIQHTVEYNQSGGGDVANNIAASVQTMLQNLVDAHNAQTASTADEIAINPYLLPRMGFSGGGAWMEVVLPDGTAVREGINQDNFAQRLLGVLQDNGGIAPAWQVQTQQQHYQQALQEGQTQEQAEAPLRLGAGGQAYAGDEAFSLQGNAAEAEAEAVNDGLFRRAA